VRFQVLTAAGMKATAFCCIAPCSLVEVEWRFRGVKAVIFRCPLFILLGVYILVIFLCTTVADCRLVQKLLSDRCSFPVFWLGLRLVRNSMLVLTIISRFVKATCYMFLQNI
jgi:hypothetical protein